MFCFPKHHIQWFSTYFSGHLEEKKIRNGQIPSSELTWLFIVMGFPSRSLKLLLPRLLEGPPLTEGPGPSLPDRSVRIRIGPLGQPSIKRRDISSLVQGGWGNYIYSKSTLFYRISPLLAFTLPSFFQPGSPSRAERWFDMLGIVDLAPMWRSCMGTGLLSSLSLRSVSWSSAREECGGSALRTESKFFG